MDLATLEQITPELSAALFGRRLGRVFQLSRFDFAIDFRLAGSDYLFVSVSPSNPRIYLIRRRLRDLERAALTTSVFSNALRKQLSNASVTALEQIAGERAVKVKFDGESELGKSFERSLIAQLTGRSANLFITDERGFILDRLRETRGDGQELGTVYSPPEKRDGAHPTFSREVHGGSLSEYLDRLDLEKREAETFGDLVLGARSRLRQRLTKVERRKEKLEEDLRSHGDADKWKRFGDILLSNVSTAKRTDGAFLAVDYFDEKLSEVAIPFDNDDSITETAEKYFRKYTKARNAKQEVAIRLEMTNSVIAELTSLGARLDMAVDQHDSDFIASFLIAKEQQRTANEKKRSLATAGVARSFTSSDGFEILVGKKAKDNDVLTFKIAKSLDTWMHAADYPGSHVVIRNPNRTEIPHRTLLEAAELAAFYSQGNAQVKAAVHYTQKKFVNKPKGAAPGLVSLSSFKTLLVEPKVPESLTA